MEPTRETRWHALPRWLGSTSWSVRICLPAPAGSKSWGRRRLEKLAAETGGVVGEVRGRGAMIGIELVDPETQEPATDLTKTVAAEVNRLGVVVLTCGTSGNVIRLLPPLVIPDELLLDGIDVISDVLKGQLNG